LGKLLAPGQKEAPHRVAPVRGERLGLNETTNYPPSWLLPLPLCYSALRCPGKVGFVPCVLALIRFRQRVRKSWFTREGARRKARDLQDRCPNLHNDIVLTLTADRVKELATSWAVPEGGFGSPREAWRAVVDRIGDAIETLRRRYKGDFEYCWKLEFHPDSPDWPHLHCIIRSKRALPMEQWEKLWGLGIVWAQRIKTKGLGYIFKYCCKYDVCPDWVKNEHVVRVLQPSRGFFSSVAKDEVKRACGRRAQKRLFNLRRTIGERLERARREVLVEWGAEAAGKFDVSKRRVARMFKPLDEMGSGTAELRACWQMDAIGFFTDWHGIIFDTSNDEHCRWLASHLEHAPPELVEEVGGRLVGLLPPGRDQRTGYLRPRQLDLFEEPIALHPVWASTEWERHKSRAAGRRGRVVAAPKVACVV